MKDRYTVFTATALLLADQVERDRAFERDRHAGRAAHATARQHPTDLAFEPPARRTFRTERRELACATC